MRLLFVMDPLDGLLPDKDTTFAFLRAAQAAGHESLHAEIRDVFLREGRLFARARRASVSDVPPHTSVGEAVTVAV